jgi:hypothetical protein
MASNNPNEGLVTLLQVAGLGNSASLLVGLSEQAQNLKSASDLIAQQQAAILSQAVSSGSADGRSESVWGAIGGFLGGGLGVVPLVAGLASLLGSVNDQTAPPGLNRFVPPPGIRIDAGFSDAAGGGAFGVDASGGLPRAVTQPAPQITVQVQAMDSQSFLDRSQDIAQAVRQAMLETTVLNDVVREV